MRFRAARFPRAALFVGMEEARMTLQKSGRYFLFFVVVWFFYGCSKSSPTAPQKSSALSLQLVVRGKGSGNGEFNAPLGICGRSGLFYIADYGNHRIQKFDASFNFLLMWGTQGSGAGQFDLPYDVEVDASGNVYVSEHANSRIQKFDANGNFILQWGGYGLGTPGLFFGPVRLAVSGNRLYVSDTGNNRVQYFDLNGAFLGTFGSFGTGPGEFNRTGGVAVDAGGRVWVGDRGNHRLQVFDNSGTFQKMILISTPGGGTPSPGGMAFQSSTLWVVDDGSSRLYQFDGNGNLEATFTLPGMLTPVDVTVSGSTLYFLDADGAVYKSG